VTAVFGKGQTGLEVANEEDDGEKDGEDVKSRIITSYNLLY